MPQARPSSPCSHSWWVGNPRIDELGDGVTFFLALDNGYAGGANILQQDGALGDDEGPARIVREKRGRRRWPLPCARSVTRPRGRVPCSPPAHGEARCGWPTLYRAPFWVRCFSLRYFD